MRPIHPTLNSQRVHIPVVAIQVSNQLCTGHGVNTFCGCFFYCLKPLKKYDIHWNLFFRKIKVLSHQVIKDLHALAQRN